MRPRSAGSSWQAWDRRERRRRTINLIAWLITFGLAFLVVVGAFTVVAFLIIVLS
jgi:hypothetical protein